MLQKGQQKIGPPSWPRLLNNAAIVVTSVLIGLIGAELVTRFVAPQLMPARSERVGFWEYDEILGWAHKPNQRTNFAHPEFNVSVIINSDGLRDDEIDNTLLKRRALVLGDSYGWGFGIEHSERFDTLLEDSFSNWEFINASVSGYGTDQQYLWMGNKGLSYKPEFLLLLLYENDFTNNTSSSQYWYNKPKYEFDENGDLRLTNVPVPPLGAKQRMKQFFIGRTYLYGYLYKLLVIPLEFKWLAYKRQRKAELGIGEKPNASAQEITGALLLAMNQLANDNGVEFLLVSVPGTGRRVEYLSDFSNENGINYLALDEGFLAVDEDVYRIRGDLHWNAVGHKLAASFIEEHLVASGVLDANIAKD